MTYTYEIIFINSRPEFFDDVAGVEYQDFVEEIIHRLKDNGLIDKDIYRMEKSIHAYPDNTWAQNTKIYGFKTKDAISTFMATYGESDEPMRLKRSAWNKSNKVTGEFNMLDDRGEIVQIHTSCQSGHCNNKIDGCDSKTTRRCFDASSDVIKQRWGKIYHITPV